jgi:hypothetical protein
MDFGAGRPFLTAAKDFSARRPDQLWGPPCLHWVPEETAGA